VAPAAAPHPTSRFVLPDEAATARAGAALGKAIESATEAILQSGLVIGLSGELGSGKTALVRAVLRRLGAIGTVRSPTFSLLELYSISRLNFYHFDFYRFLDPTDFTAAGFRDFFAPGSVCAIEWPERAGNAGLSIDLRIEMQIADSGRIAHVAALTQVGQSCLQEMDREWQMSPDGAC
jgi:tRNA threonylcarbamoyladenosine biosynthesis protein TsaE